MKLLNELTLTLENPHWAVNTEFALLDTILTMHPEIFELVRNDFSAHTRKSLGRKDSPTIEQILRGALYKEMKSLTYRELEYAQHDSRICALFIKLDGRSPISFAVWQKYISLIKGKTLKKVMVAIGTYRVRSCGLTFPFFSAMFTACRAPSAWNTHAQSITSPRGGTRRRSSSRPTPTGRTS